MSPSPSLQAALHIPALSLPPPCTAEGDLAVLPVSCTLQASQWAGGVRRGEHCPSPCLWAPLAELLMAPCPEPAPQDFPLHTHHGVSFHGKRSRIAFLQIWGGLSGHVLADDNQQLR